MAATAQNSAVTAMRLVDQPPPWAVVAWVSCLPVVVAMGDFRFSRPDCNRRSRSLTRSATLFVVARGLGARGPSPPVGSFAPP